MDTPVKRYSSGMYLRLGFAIAAHMEAEILLVDEVLAVGDAEFQRRCLGKMNEVERSGRTVLFVSHNMDAMARLCATTIWLERGRVRRIGPTDEVIDEYMRSTVGTVDGDRPSRSTRRRRRRSSVSPSSTRHGTPQAVLTTRGDRVDPVSTSSSTNRARASTSAAWCSTPQRRRHPRRGAERRRVAGAMASRVGTGWRASCRRS